MPVAHFIRLLLNTGQLTFTAQPTHAYYNTAPLPRKPGNRWLLGAGFAAGAVVLVVFASHARAITPDQEIAWLNRLAKDGDAGAQLQLGLAYREGRYGLTPDKKTGVYWITQAARNGDGYAAGLMVTAAAENQSTTRGLPTAQRTNWLTAMAPTLEACAALCGEAALSETAPQTDSSPMNARAVADDD